MKKLAAALLTTTAMAVAPLAIAPVANADICAGAHGRHVGVGGCTNVAGDVATGVAIAAATNPYIPGEIPCYTVEGAPYYTSRRPLLIGSPFQIDTTRISSSRPAKSSALRL
jgi:hypothetical protein